MENIRSGAQQVLLVTSPYTFIDTIAIIMITAAREAQRFAAESTYLKRPRYVVDGIVTVNCAGASRRIAAGHARTRSFG